MKKARLFAAGLLVLGLILSACASTIPRTDIQQKGSVVDQSPNFKSWQLRIAGAQTQTEIETIESDLRLLAASGELTLAEYQQLLNELKAQERLEQLAREKAEAERRKAEEEQRQVRLAREKAEDERRKVEEEQRQVRLAQERAEAERRRKAEIDAINAKGVSAEDFEYDINSKGDGIIITKYKGLATIVNIPTTIEGFPVKELGRMVFQNNDDITSVTIPDSVTVIYASGYDGNQELFDQDPFDDDGNQDLLYDYESGTWRGGVGGRWLVHLAIAPISNR
jgi:hypothetical protein